MHISRVFGGEPPWVDGGVPCFRWELGERDSHEGAPVGPREFEEERVRLWVRGNSTRSGCAWWSFNGGREVRVTHQLAVEFYYERNSRKPLDHREGVGAEGNCGDLSFRGVMWE